ncbi:MAG: branched-chain amino acid ABC transporter permease [Hyphomicrobiaceae bacterium]|nr:branched-chain amino acid ABC transporter permease [Hyphomicrobiaceae bacterium]
MLRAHTFDERMAAGLLAPMVLLPLIAPILGGSYMLHVGERAIILAIAALSLELLVGVGGMVSFGHGAFLGIGAYAGGIAASHGLGTLAVALPAALAASALFALLTGAIAVRTRGVYFIMITLAFGQMAFFVATSLAPYGGDDGLSWPGRTLVLGTQALKNETVFFYATLALAIAAYIAVSRLIASRFGRVLRGLTGSEMRLQAIGFAPYPYRLTAYVIAGTLCGLAGFLLGNYAEFVSPAFMHWQRSGELIVAVLLGGTGRVYGPALGAIAFVLLEEVLSGLTEHWKAILGPLLVFVVLFSRGGMAGGIEHAIAQWRRTGMTPRQLPRALVVLARHHAAQWSAAATTRWRRIATRGRVLIDTMRPLVEQAGAHLGGARRELKSIAPLVREPLVRIHARCRLGAMAAHRRIGALRPRIDRATARLSRQCGRLALASRHRFAHLTARFESTARATYRRWHPREMAFARRLRSLAMLAERRIADAVHRWRRR